MPRRRQKSFNQDLSDTDTKSHQQPVIDPAKTAKKNKKAKKKGKASIAAITESVDIPSPENVSSDVQPSAIGTAGHSIQGKQSKSNKFGIFQQLDPSDEDNASNQSISETNSAVVSESDDKLNETAQLLDEKLQFQNNETQPLSEGRKLSRKEMKKLKNEQKKEAILAEIAESHAGYNQFSVSQQSNLGDKQRLVELSKDIVIDSFSLSAPGRELFVNTQLKIVHGRRYGLVGPNGHGKTTLLTYIAQRKFNGIPTSLDILLCEQEMNADPTKNALDILLESDDKVINLQNELKRLESSGHADVARIDEIYDELRMLQADSAESRAIRILNGLGFSGKMQKRRLCDFSGGWRMRVSLARALFRRPSLLLLDEPTNHLDLNAVIWLDNYLQGWKETLLIVSHDQNFLDNVCTDIIHLDLQKLNYYKGNYQSFKKMYVQRCKEYEKEYDKQVKELKRLKESGKSTSQATEKVSNRAKKGSKQGTVFNNTNSVDGSDPKSALLTKRKDYQVKFQFPPVAPLNPPILGLFNVTFGFPGQNLLFKNLNFGIDLESRIAIVGPNGVGKSTLLKLLTGELSPISGDRKINHRLRLAKFDQHSADQFDLNKSACDYMCGTYNLPHQDARRALGSVGLPGKAHTIPMHALSGGQKARVAMADLAAKSPDILILDEPTNNLDLESIDALAEAIHDYEGGVVLVSHDERLIRETDCQLWVVEDKGIFEIDGDFDTYRNEILESLGETAYTNPSAAAAATA